MAEEVVADAIRQLQIPEEVPVRSGQRLLQPPRCFGGPPWPSEVANRDAIGPKRLHTAIGQPAGPALGVGEEREHHRLVVASQKDRLRWKWLVGEDPDPRKQSAAMSSRRRCRRSDLP